MSRIYSIILAAVLLWPTGAASDQSIWTICGLTLKLGMPESAVRLRWSKECKVTEPRPGILILARKRADQFDLLGSVIFAGGRVVSASREWLPAGARNGQEFAEAIFGALSNAGLLGSTVQIDATEQHSPEFSIHTIEITSPGRRVAFSFGKNVAAGVSEMIGNSETSNLDVPRFHPLNRHLAPTRAILPTTPPPHLSVAMLN